MEEKVKSGWWVGINLLLILGVILLGGVILGVVYPWMGERLSRKEQSTAEVDRQALEHGHSHEVYDYSHGEQESRKLDFNKSFEKAGYEIVFFDLRYTEEPNLRTNEFKFKVKLENDSFEPYAGQSLVCNVLEGDRVVASGKGVKLSKLEDVYPGEELEWEVTVALKEEERWVSACRYTPTGAFEASKTVEVEFPRP